MVSLDELVGGMRDKVSEFCVDKCSSECCRCGYEMEVTGREAAVIFGVLNVEGLEDRRLDASYNDKFDLVLEPCPALRFYGGKYKCGIYNDFDKPKVCGEYPVWVEDGKINLDNRCFAVCSGSLDEDIDRLSLEGVDVGVRA